MAPLEDAQAPSVAITQVGTIMVDAMRQLTASVSGGRYDTISYAWSVTQGTGTLAGSGARVTYNAPSAAEAAEVTCAVTVEGTGTNAVDGTSDTATDTEDFSVMAMVMVSTAIYAGWSADETIETADFAGASEFTSGIDGTLPATASNGYIWFAVPAGATVGTVFIRGGSRDQFGHYSQQTGTVDDPDGNATDVYITNFLQLAAVFSAAVYRVTTS